MRMQNITLGSAALVAVGGALRYLIGAALFATSSAFLLGSGPLHQRGHTKVQWLFAFTNAAYNLVRMRTLLRIGVAT